ncbi:CUB domain-containing protein 2-like [Ptychodera flava]|uniref:CUB domain-containing protein 2-like n=1 Tax=Ptychodera flava TaxID=63121 RepID=UPI00396A277A
MSFSLSLLIVLAAAYAAQVDGQTTPLPVNCRESVQIPKGRYVDITSPNYPENYPYNADCEWIISTENNTKIYVEHFDFFTEADFDFYSAGNGKTPSQNSSVIWQFSGSFPPEDFMSTDITVWITFTSDHIISYRGFHTRVHDTGLSSCSNLCGLDNPAQGCNCEKTCVLTETCCSDYFEVCAGDCNEVVTVPEGGQVTITSPNYPENYPDDALCQWIVSSERRSIMQVRFTEFYTQPGKDFFFAGNGDDPSEENSVIWMHSGFVAPPDFLSSDSTVWMRFSSDYAGTEKGFHVEVEDMYGKGSCLDACDTFDTQFQCSCQRDCVFDANCCPDYFELCAGNCIETLYVNSEEKIDVYSPNYPANYPNNARCEYIIYSNGSTSQLLVDFVDFSTELNYDHFFAGYGDQPNVNATTEIWAHSGSSLPPSYSTSYESVWFRLFTDSSGTDRGFHATVESLGATCHGMCGTFNSAFQCSCYNDCGYDGNCCPDFAEACGTEGCVEDFILEQGGSVIITSPNYPGTYPNDALCRWTVNPPKEPFCPSPFRISNSKAAATISRPGMDYNRVRKPALSGAFLEPRHQTISWPTIAPCG